MTWLVTAINCLLLIVIGASTTVVLLRLSLYFINSTQAERLRAAQHHHEHQELAGMDRSDPHYWELKQQIYGGQDGSDRAADDPVQPLHPIDWKRHE